MSGVLIQIRHIMREIINRVFISPTNISAYQLVRYLFVGGLAFAVDYACLFILVEEADLYYLLSAAVSFCLGLIVNYLLSISWVFNRVGKRNRGKEFLFFFLIGLVGLLVNEVIMFCFTDLLKVSYLLSKIISVVVVFFWNFFARKIALSSCI